MPALKMESINSGIASDRNKLANRQMQQSINL
jgi:hypothetical protein